MIYVKRHNRFIDIWKRIWDVNALWADGYFICNVWNVTVEILRIQCKSRSRKKVTLNIKCVYWSLFMVLKCPNCHVIHSRDANENTYFFHKELYCNMRLFLHQTLHQFLLLHQFLHQFSLPDVTIRDHMWNTQKRLIQYLRYIPAV